MNTKTKDKYIKIFALHKQGIPPHVITEKFDCDTRTLQRAVQWCVKNSLKFTSAEHLTIQLEKVQELKLQTQQRLRKVQEGSMEKSVKKHYGQEVESVERTKYNSNAEVALLRLLKDLIAEESTLLGVYDACVPEEAL